MVLTVSGWKFRYTLPVNRLLSHYSCLSTRIRLRSFASSWRRLRSNKKGLMHDHEHLCPTKTLPYAVIDFNRPWSEPNAGNGLRLLPRRDPRWEAYPD